MERRGFTMQLKPGMKAEYRKRHDEIWPELSEALAAAGVRDYSIFLDERSGTLFAFQRVTPNNTADRLPDLPIMRKWWDAMAPLMAVNPDNSPVVTPLEEVFHFD